VTMITLLLVMAVVLNVRLKQDGNAQENLQLAAMTVEMG